MKKKRISEEERIERDRLQHFAEGRLSAFRELRDGLRELCGQQFATHDDERARWTRTFLDLLERKHKEQMEIRDRRKDTP